MLKKSLGLALLAIFVSSCVAGAVLTSDVQPEQRIPKGLIFGSEWEPQGSHRDCENVGEFLCFEVGTFEPFMMPKNEAALTALMKQNEVGPFGAQAEWSAGPWQFELYRKENEFFGFRGNFYWVMTYFNNSNDGSKKSMNVSIYSYGHGLLMNIPTADAYGVDAPIIVPRPVIMTYQPQSKQ